MDLDLISLKAPAYWAELNALNNNIIPGGCDVGEGCPAERSHHITVKGCTCGGVDGPHYTVLMDSRNKNLTDWQFEVARLAGICGIKRYIS